ncbi:phosphodiester glycosidase family protein [Oribacterium parvum]|uniref:phosphodiester glycosidase family protein n=1 Tax=Oribacterium parvum TaxID=1501329 RepID=UPI0028F11926|nr:phosphodiester glycosidase family protein [Oribacterium parvum]
MKRLNTKKAGLLYGLVLFSYTSYALLDTFVIPHPMKTVMAESANIEATSGIKESIEAKIHEKLGLSEATETSLTENTDGSISSSGTNSVEEADSSSTTSSKENNNESSGGSTTLTASSTVEGGSVIGSYSDSNVSITLKEYREYDSAIYVADITVSDVSYLKTALASNTYGRNITDTTSNIASDNNAILAINGDYYGARQSGYVIRNGSLYRNSSGNRDALAIMKNGEFEFVSEGETSAETLLQNGALQVFSFGPVLLEDGSISVTENDEVGMAMASNPRTAIGYLGKNHYVFVVSDGRTSESAGLSLYELASFMKSLGALDAYNLDGGGSSTMVFKGEVINTPTTNGHSSEERAVSDILYIGGKQS